MKTFLNLSVILSMVINCTGCGGDLPEFPAHSIFVIDTDKQTCSEHKIIQKDPVKVDKGVFYPWSNCPTVFGFRKEEMGGVMSWIRQAQNLAKERCN